MARKIATRPIKTPVLIEISDLIMDLKKIAAAKLYFNVKYQSDPLEIHVICAARTKNGLLKVIKVKSLCQLVVAWYSYIDKVTIRNKTVDFHLIDLRLHNLSLE